MEKKTLHLFFITKFGIWDIFIIFRRYPSTAVYVNKKIDIIDQQLGV